MVYGSNLTQKDNPRWAISNAAETPKVPGTAPGPPEHPPEPGHAAAARAGWLPEPGLASLACLASDAGGALRSAPGTAISWLAGLPRRAGRHLFAVNDAEAGWWGWQVTEVYGGLGRRYRDPRFGALRPDGTSRQGSWRPRPGGL